jgi:hypothetical protein
MRLYDVITTVKEYDGCKDVTFHWFCSDERPQPGRPYAELIKDYEPPNRYTEDYIDELFTEDEALQVKQYLDREHSDQGTTISPKCPCPSQTISWAMGRAPSAVAMISTCWPKSRNIPCRSKCGGISISSVASWSTGPTSTTIASCW